jgi:hypothetical protein
MWIATPQNIHPHPDPPIIGKEASPSPQSSPLKGEEDQGEGFYSERQIMEGGRYRLRLAMPLF